MVIARIKFKEEMADYWVQQSPSSDRVRTVVEIAFENPKALIECLKEIEDAVEDCTAIVDGKTVLSLTDFKV